MLDGKEVYSIPYDDLGYPENAVSIMSDDIIRNLKKHNKKTSSISDIIHSQMSLE